MAEAKIITRKANWSKDIAERAKQKHCYVKIGPNTGELRISGAEKRWKSPENEHDIYVGGEFRIVGTTKELTEFFRGLNKTDNEIKEIISMGYSSKNYNTSKKEQFERELQEYDDWRQKQPKTTKPTVHLEDLSFIVGGLHGASVLKTHRERKSTNVARNRHIPLKQRLTSLTEGKVLDVSYMENDGSGIKIIEKPRTTKSKKIGVEGLAIVSSSRTTYAQALKLLGSEYSKYIESYDEMARGRESKTTEKVPQKDKKVVIKMENIEPKKVVKQVPPLERTKSENKVEAPPEPKKNPVSPLQVKPVTLGGRPKISAVKK